MHEIPYASELSSRTDTFSSAEYNQDYQLVLDALNETSEHGAYECKIEESLHPQLIELLREKGYEVDEDSYEDCIVISWE